MAVTLRTEKHMSHYVDFNFVRSFPLRQIYYISTHLFIIDNYLCVSYENILTVDIRDSPSFNIDAVLYLRSVSRR